MIDGRISELKILKQMEEHHLTIAKGSYVDSGHTTCLIRYQESLIKMNGRVKNPMHNIITANNWVQLGVVNAKEFNYNIKLEHQKQGGKKYDLTQIAVGRSIYSREYLQWFVKQFNRKADEIELWTMAEDYNLFVPRPDTPLMIVGADKAWMYIIAPRVGEEDYDIVWNALPLNEQPLDMGENDELVKVNAEIAEWDAEQNKPLTEEEIALADFEDEFAEHIKKFNPLTGEFE
jgi:hypothetical protein